MNIYRYVNKSSSSITAGGITIPSINAYTSKDVSIPALDILSDGWSIDRYLNGVLANTKNDPATESKELVTSNKTLYVRKDGSNSNSGLENTSSGAFLTIQYAVDYVRDYYKFGYLNTYITINVGDGIYEEMITMPQIEGLANYIYITGNETTLDAVKIYPVSGYNAVTATGPLSRVVFSGITFDGTRLSNYGNIIQGSAGARVYVYKNIHIIMNSGVYALQASGAGTRVNTWSWDAMKVSGNGRAFGYASDGAEIFLEGNTATIVNLTVTEGFLKARKGSLVCWYFTSMTGTVTGQKYNASGLSIVYLDGTEADIPGASAGILSSGSVLA